MAKDTRRWIQKKRHFVPLALLAAGVIMAVISYVSPWPSALLIRAVFEDNARKTVAEMSAHVPGSGVETQHDVPFEFGGTALPFDVYFPTGTTEQLPTVVWIHGGAWISGSKENVDPYVEILASHGYTTVSLDYTVAPEATYPTALTQLNAALEYLVEHAGALHIDPDRIVLAGDSAGANLASQLAVVATNPGYAEELELQPALSPEQLRGLVLNCGIYDVSGIPNAPGIGGWGFRIALWSYIGAKDWSVHPGGDEMSTLDYVTADFPATWISGGNVDPLTESQSKPMAAKLTGLGLDVTEVFYPADTTPGLPHEYQFQLDDPNAQLALESTLSFLARVTAD